MDEERVCLSREAALRQVGRGERERCAAHAALPRSIRIVRRSYSKPFQKRRVLVRLNQRVRYRMSLKL
jgi:hypothetical protein